MSLFDHEDSFDRLPVSLVTGFLGSGKTTLINRLIKHPDTGDCAVIINEFGEVALDHHLVESVEGETLVLSSGCVCCALRDDLVVTLRQLLAQRAEGKIPPFARIVIETTGLADPAPIVQMLLNNPLVSSACELDSIVTTVDSINAPTQLEAHEEAVKQVAVADRLLMTKTDLAGEATRQDSAARVEALNVMADRHDVTNGEIAPGLLFGCDAGPEAYEARLPKGHNHDHTHGIETFVLEFDQPILWRTFSRWLADLRSQCGERLLRVKGILDLEGEKNPVAVHGVHHVFHPPVQLASWPGEERRSRIVFITRGLSRELVLESWNDYRAGLEG